jgi:3-isopropylmalate/(R)-2-methylmalate dehydratase large subunit
MGDSERPQEIRPGEYVAHIGNVEVLHGVDGLVTAFRLAPGAGVLILHSNPQRITQQLGPSAIRATELPPDDKMISGVSTDAIIAARPDCYRFDTASLGQVPLRTLQVDGVNPVPPEAVANGNFGGIAAGPDWGCGSSREHAALALLGAGIGAVYASSIAPIHFDNLVANGMFPITSRKTFERFMAGDTIAITDIDSSLTEFHRRIMRQGNVLKFMQAWAEGREPIAPIETEARPMTIVERIMASHLNTTHGFVKPGDAGMLQVDQTLCVDYTTAQIAAMIQAGLGRAAMVKTPNNHYTFSDHLELMQEGQAGATVEEIAAVTALRVAQAQVAAATGIHFPQRQGGGSAAICHQYFREEIVLPGRVIVGTDSHMCAAGFGNAYAFGVGSSPLAIVWEHDVIQTSVPETIRIEFTGELPQSASGKDVMLYLAHMAKRRAGGKDRVQFTGRVLEFGGEGLESLTADDQWVLTNMATECSAKTGIIEPNAVLRTYLVEQRGISKQEVDESFVWPDEGAQYADVIAVDLAKVVPAVSLPGHTGNMVPLTEAAGRPIDMAYSGSCTSGSYDVLFRLAEIFDGKHVSIPMHVQAGSDAVLQLAKQTGVIDILEGAGVTVIEVAGCGACLAAGPGGPKKGETVISSTNRNFHGRMGDGDAYLANVGVVAATALLGRIPSMEEYLHVLGESADLRGLRPPPPNNFPGRRGIGNIPLQPS